MKTSLARLLSIGLLIIMTSIFTACGISAMQESSINFREHTAVNGRVVGSVTFVNTKPSHRNYWLRLSSKSTDKKIARRNSTSVVFSANGLPKEFVGELERGQTYLFTEEMMVGDYDVSAMVFVRPIGMGTEYITYSGFSIPFSVQKGKITYIGNIIVDESIMGQDSFISYKNMYDRDINAMRKTYPEVVWTRALNDTTRKIEYNEIFTLEKTTE